MNRSLHRWLAACWLSCAFAVFCSSWHEGGVAFAAGPAVDPASIAGLIGDLGADRFATRQRAERLLWEIGVPAREALNAAALAGPAEVRVRAGQIASGIEHRFLLAQFERLGSRQDDRDIDLEEALWLGSKVLDPQVRREDMAKALDELAAAVRGRLGDQAPRQADPRRVAQALREELFIVQGLRVNAENVNSPDNASLARVLAAHKGSPFMLAQVLAAVGRRLDLPLAAVAVPGRPLVKYEGSKAPRGFPREDVFIDPSAGGHAITRDQLNDLLGGVNVFSESDDAGDFLPRRMAVLTMLNDLREALEAAHQPDKASRVAEYWQLVAPGLYSSLEP